MEVLSNQTRGMNLESDCEDNLCYGSQSSTNSYPLSRTYSESHGSVSSASSVRGPVTPNSGRSSPGVQHQSSFYSSPPLFGWTQESEYNTLYHKDDTIKMEGGQEPPYPDPGYHTPPQTGIRRGGIPGSTLEPVPYPSYQPVEPISTLVQDTPIHSTNASSQNLPIHAQQWGPYTYCESNDHHELDNPYLQACQSSRWSSHDSDNYLGPPFETAQPPSYPGLEKNTTELSTRTQPGFRVAKRNRLHPIRADDRAFTVYTKGTFRCLHENCTERRPFKRQEHLKRHVTTMHTLEVRIPCTFCSPFKIFNRRDNWRSHMNLHTKEGSNGRTKYYPEAAAVLAAENITKKKRGRKDLMRREMAKVAALDRRVRI